MLHLIVSGLFNPEIYSKQEDLFIIQTALLCIMI